MKYLKQFVIGSSYLVFIPFFWFVKNNLKDKNYTYFDYTISAPIYFGVWNVISLLLAEQLGLSMKERFLLVTPLSALSIMIFAKYYKKYNFTKKQWSQYSILLFAVYIVVWNVVIYNIEKSI